MQNYSLDLDSDAWLGTDEVLFHNVIKGEGVFIGGNFLITTDV